MTSVWTISCATPLAQPFVHPFPGRRLDRQEALVEEAEVHDGPLSHAEEVLEERLAADADHRLAEGKPFTMLDDQSPQDVLGGVIPLPPLGAALGQLLEVLVDGREDLGILVEDLTDRPILVTILSYDLGQPVIAGLETQHGFLLPTHPCSPWGSLEQRQHPKNKDASFLCNPVRPLPTRNPFRNRN